MKPLLLALTAVCLLGINPGCCCLRHFLCDPCGSMCDDCGGCGGDCSGGGCALGGGCGGGCGEKYYGDWHSNYGGCCEPCDTCGNFTGGGGPHVVHSAPHQVIYDQGEGDGVVSNQPKRTTNSTAKRVVKTAKIKPRPEADYDIR